MNNQEARMILQGYRPGGQDASDSLFTEALEQAWRDPELQKWFAKEQAFDLRMQAKLKEAIPIPLGLKSNLLAQRKMVRSVPWWHQFAWPTAVAAAAAALILFAALAVTWMNQPSKPLFADFREVMVKNALQETGHLNFVAQDMANIKSWLKTQNVNTDFDMPAALRDAPVHGCKVVDWHGHKATLLCFMPNGGGHVDLFVVDCTHFRDFTPSGKAQFVTSNGTTTAVWCNSDKTYLLASTEGEQSLRKIL